MEKGKKIKSIRAREILDSRGNPTVEVEVETDLGKFLASVPSGASRGKNEAVEIRDGGKRFLGKGVKRAVRNVNEIIAKKIRGKDCTNQEEIDLILRELDGTKNKSCLGANAICPVSMAIARAGAFFEKLPLYLYLKKIYLSSLNEKQLKKRPLKIPRPSFNVINGGLHAGNELNFQEFMVCPKEKTFEENLKIACEIYYQLKETISKKYGKLATNLGDEGGFAPPLKFPEEAIELILKSARFLGYEKKTSLILDVASSQFFHQKRYQTNFGNFSSEEFTNYYLSLIKKYPIEAIEDPFAENDFDGWKKLREKMPQFLLIGDDLLTTNPERIEMAEKMKLCNGAIIKINQIGTVSEAINAIKKARSFGWKIMVSHRSGETNDDFISDFAVGVEADFIKTGAPARGERVAKYNRLLKIEKETKIKK